MIETKTNRDELDLILDTLGLDKRQVPPVWYQAAACLQIQAVGYRPEQVTGGVPGEVPESHHDGPDASAEDSSRLFLSVLEPDNLRLYGSWIGLDDSCINELIEAAGIIRYQAPISLFLQIIAWSLFRAGLKPGDESFRVPELPRQMDQRAGLFPVLALLAGIPDMVKFYAAHHIPHEILASTLSDIRIWMDDYQRNNGRLGISVFWWLHLHLSGVIFRIGRLQYIHTHFSGPLKAYRNRTSGRVCALSLPGITYRGDGQVDGTNGMFDRHAAWTASLSETEQLAAGSPIRPRGEAIKPQLDLPLDQWQLMLAPGDGVLDIHIPEDGRLDHQACGQSMREAIVFFQTHFPDLEVKALVCTSWLLDPQLQVILDRKANLCRFQSELYLYPIRSDDRQTFERVFHSTPDEVRRLQADSSLQKAIIKHVKAGHRMHASGMFILADDVAAWGTHEGPAYQDCDNV